MTYNILTALLPAAVSEKDFDHGVASQIKFEYR